LIPHLGYLACAIATVVCYGSMMVISFIQGQKHYPIPYDIKNGFLYIALAVFFFGIHYSLRMLNTEIYILHAIGITLLLIYGWIVVKREKKELVKIPVLNRLYK
jgi:Ca2+/Na+ antiporter